MEANLRATVVDRRTNRPRSLQLEFLPRHGVIDEQTNEQQCERVHWREYYWLRKATEDQFAALQSFQTAIGYVPFMTLQTSETKKRTRKGKAKSSNVGGTQLSSAALTPQNLFGLAKVGADTLDDAQRMPTASPESMNEFATKMMQFILELFAHVTNPFILRHASKDDLENWSAELSALVSSVDILLAVPGILSDHLHTSKRIRLCMRVIRNCIEPSKDFIESNNKLEQHGFSPVSFARTAVALVPDITFNQAGFVREPVKEASLHDFTLLCADLIRIAVTDDNWHLFEMDNDPSYEEEQQDNSGAGTSDAMDVDGKVPHRRRKKALDQRTSEINGLVSECEFLLDKMAKNVSSDVALPIMNSVIQALTRRADNGDWRALYVQLDIIRLACEGLAPSMAISQLESWVNICCEKGAESSHPAVRLLCVGALARLAADSEGELVVPCYNKMLPAMLKLTRDKDMRVRSTAFEGAVSLIRLSTPNIIEPLLPTILETARPIIDVPVDPDAAATHVKEFCHLIPVALTCIAAVFEPLKAAGAPLIMPVARRHLETPPRFPSAKLDVKFVERLIECATVVCCNVSTETNWRNTEDINMIIKALQRFGSADGGGPSKEVRLPNTNDYYRAAWLRVCVALKDDAAPFLQDILPIEFDLAVMEPGMTLLGEDEEEQEGVQYFEIMDQTYGLNVDRLTQRLDALVRLEAFIKCGPCIRPYLQRILAVARSSMDFELHTEIRLVSTQLFLKLLKFAHQHVTDYPFANDSVDFICESMSNEVDHEVSSAKFKLLSETINMMPDHWERLDDPHYVLDMLQIIVSQMNHAQPLQICDRDDFTNGVMDASTFRRNMQNDEKTAASAVAMASALIRRSHNVVFALCGVGILPDGTDTGFWLSWLAPLNSEADGCILPNEPFPFIKVSVGLAIANELLEQGIPAHKVLQFAPHVLLKFARSRCPSLRALAVTGLSIFIAEYPALTQNLEELVHCITEVLDPRFPRACCSATYGLGRILVAMASNLRGSLYKEVSGLYWDHLPLEQPDEETASVCRQLATLIARREKFIVDAFEADKEKFDAKILKVRSMPGVSAPDVEALDAAVSAFLGEPRH